MRRVAVSFVFAMGSCLTIAIGCGTAPDESVSDTNEALSACLDSDELAEQDKVVADAAAPKGGKPTPKTCKDAGADAAKPKKCDPADLADGCTCDRLDELYTLQKQICGQVRTCEKADFCSNLDDKMAIRRNCINLRRDVQLCYKKPDFDGHQEQIDAQCRGLGDCVGKWRGKTCGDSLPIIIPAACPTVK